MAKFKLTTSGMVEKTVEANAFATNGEFVDFTAGYDEDGNDRVVLRFRASNVYSIERVEG